MRKEKRQTNISQQHYYYKYNTIVSQSFIAVKLVIQCNSKSELSCCFIDSLVLHWFIAASSVLHSFVVVPFSKRPFVFCCFNYRKWNKDGFNFIASTSKLKVNKITWINSNSNHDEQIRKEFDWRVKMIKIFLLVKINENWNWIKCDLSDIFYFDYFFKIKKKFSNWGYWACCVDEN